MRERFIPKNRNNVYGCRWRKKESVCLRLCVCERERHRNRNMHL